MLLGEDGSVWATGLNDCGQLGDGTVRDQKKYVLIIGQSGAMVCSRPAREDPTPALTRTWTEQMI